MKLSINKTISRLLAIIVTLSLISPSVLFAVQTPKEITPQAPKEPIVVNGDNVEYFQEKKMVTGVGNVSIKYKDITLSLRAKNGLVYASTGTPTITFGWD